MFKNFIIVFSYLCLTVGFSQNGKTLLSEKIDTKQCVAISENLDDKAIDQALDEVFPQMEYKGTAVKMVLSLIAVIVLGGITVWSFKKMHKSRLYAANANNEIKILEKRVISPKSILYLIEYEGKKALVSESHLDMKIKILD